MQFLGRTGDGGGSNSEVTSQVAAGVSAAGASDAGGLSGEGCAEGKAGTFGVSRSADGGAAGRVSTVMFAAISF